AGLDYGPANAPFQTIDEMSLVLGMTPDTLALARPYLSIYTQSGQPNAEGASDVVRRALALAKQKIRAGEAAAEGDDADQDNADDDDSGDDAGSDAGKPDTAQDKDDSDDAAQSQAAHDERVIDVEVYARSADGGVYLRHAIVQ